MIFISAGHHEEKKGASYKGFNEYDEAKIWVDSIGHYLGHGGLIVPFGPLRNKVRFINDNCSKDDVAIEIHFNAAKDTEDNYIGRGSETLYYPNSSKGEELANRIQDELGLIFPPNRGAKEGYYRMNKKNGVDFFLARTACTALIIEPEFIHRKAKIINKREKACAIIAKVLLENSWE